MLKNILPLSVFVMSLFIGSSHALADTPESLVGTTVVDAQKAKQLLDSDKSIKIIDSRIKVEFAEEHLPGAINVVYGEKSKKEVNFDSSKDSFDVHKLPADKNTHLLIYCNGPECWKSYKASTAAVKAGYKNIYWFRSGIPDWKKSGFATQK